MATLTENTVIRHPKTGEPTLLAATGELPDWAIGLVGDHLLDHGGKVPAKGDEVAQLKARIAELEQERAESGRSPADDPGNVPASVPPRSGPGSGADKWRAYAAGQGVQVDENASRDDVIAALTAAGKPTE
jgi:hypothetical protein